MKAVVKIEKTRGAKLIDIDVPEIGSKDVLLKIFRKKRFVNSISIFR